MSKMKATEVNPLDVLREFVAKFSTQAEAANALDIAPSYLTDLLYGRRGFSEMILDKLGLRETVVKK